ALRLLSDGTLWAQFPVSVPRLFLPLLPRSLLPPSPPWCCWRAEKERPHLT
ncbi:hypothetical protein NDU88_006310, partial [Pleurodeles waltl]